MTLDDVDLLQVRILSEFHGISQICDAFLSTGDGLQFFSAA